MLKKLSLTVAIFAFALLMVGTASAADLTVDGDVIIKGNQLKFAGSDYPGVDPTVDFHRGDSNIKDMGDLYIMTDDFIHLGPTTYDYGKVLIQTKEEINAKSMTATGTLVAGRLEVDTIGANTTGLLFLAQSTTFSNDVNFDGNVGFTGDATVDGDLTVEGATFLNDTLYTNDIMPNSDSEYTIGMYDARYAAMFLDMGTFVGDFDLEEDPFDPEYQEYTIFGRLGSNYHGSLTIGSDTYLATVGGSVLVGYGEAGMEGITNLSGIIIDYESGDVNIYPESGNINTYNLLPDEDDTYNVGSSLHRYLNGYFSNSLTIGDSFTDYANYLTDGVYVYGNNNLNLYAENGDVVIESDAGDINLNPNDAVYVNGHSYFNDTMYTQNILPQEDDSYYLGTPWARYRNAFLSQGLVTGDPWGTGETISIGYLGSYTQGISSTGKILNISARGPLSDLSASNDLRLFATGDVQALATNDMSFISENGDLVMSVLDGSAVILANEDVLLSAGSGDVIVNDTLMLQSGRIYDTSGSLNFDGNNLATTGTLSAGGTTLNTLIVHGYINAEGNIYNSSGSVSIYDDVVVQGDYSSTNGDLTLTNGDLYVTNGYGYFDTGIDVSVAGSLNIGSTNATTIDIGNPTVATTINIANGVAGNTINIATDNSVADTVNVGSTLDDVNIVGSLNLNGADETGTTVIGNALAGAITLDTSAGISLDAATASNFTVTGASQDLTLSSVGGSVVMQATEAASDAIRIYASNAAGGIDVDAGTGGINILQTGAIAGNGVSIATTNAGISISAVGAANGDMTLSAGDVFDIDSVDALSLNSSAGVINIGNDNVNQNINIGTAGTRNINIGNADTDTYLYGTVHSGGNGNVDFSGAKIFRVPVDPVGLTCTGPGDLGQIYFKSSDGDLTYCTNDANDDGSTDDYGWADLDYPNT